MLKVTGFKECVAQNKRNVPLFIAEASSSLDSTSSWMHSVIAFHV